MSRRDDERIIIECLRAASGLPEHGQLSYSHDTDWYWIIEVLSWHNLIPFVYQLIPRQELPSALKAHCVSHIAKNMAKFRTKVSQFQEVASILDEAGVDYAAVKGIANSMTIYKAQPLRAMNDIDVLVRCADLNQAYETLFKAGFRVPTLPTRHRWHYRLIREEAHRTVPYMESNLGRVQMMRGEIDLDLHCNPFYGHNEHANYSPPDFYWQGATNEPTVGKRFHLLAAERQFLLQILHAAGDRFKNFTHVMDVIRLSSFYGLNPRDVIDESWITNRDQIELFIQGVEAICANTTDMMPNPAEWFAEYLASKEHNKQAVAVRTTGKQALVFHAKVLDRLSPKSKLLYAVGFFCPDPEYYKDKSFFQKWAMFTGEGIEFGRRLYVSLVTGK